MCHVSVKVSTKLWTAFFMFLSGLSHIRINRNRNSKGFMYCCMAAIGVLLFYTWIKSSWSRNHKGWPCLVRGETCIYLASYIRLNIITSALIMTRASQSHCFLRTSMLISTTAYRAFFPYFLLSSGYTLILWVNPLTDTCRRIHLSSVLVFFMIFLAPRVIRNAPITYTPPHSSPIIWCLKLYRRPTI
jgi:hypothetical protein